MYGSDHFDPAATYQRGALGVGEIAIFGMGQTKSWAERTWGGGFGPVEGSVPAYGVASTDANIDQTRQD
jgi:hypothetical protein